MDARFPFRTRAYAQDGNYTWERCHSRRYAIRNRADRQIFSSLSQVRIQSQIATRPVCPAPQVWRKFGAQRKIAQGWLCRPRACSSTGQNRPPAAKSKKKDTPKHVLLFGTSQHYRCRFSLSMCQNTNHNSIIYSSICSTFAVITISMPSYK